MNHQKPPILTLWLSLALVAVTLTSAMAGQKEIALHAWSCSAQWLLQPFIPLLTLLLTFRGGKSYAYKMTLTNAVCYLIAMLAIKGAILVPADASWHMQPFYQVALSFPNKTILEMMVWLWPGQWLLIRLIPKRETSPLPPVFFGWLPIISLLFMMSLLVSNITTQKIMYLFHVTVDVGTLFFPVTYIFNNIFTEIYGYKRSRIIIWGALLGNLFMVMVLQIIIWLPPAATWNQQAAYQTVIGTVPRIVLASTLAFFAGEFCNSFCLAKLKILTAGKYLWMRTIGSTVVGVAIDSMVFSGVAFIGALPLSIVLFIALWEYVLKVGYEVLATPITIRVVNWIKKHEHIDQYDYTTLFNPLRVRDVEYQNSET